MQSLPHPYQDEIEQFDNIVKNAEYDLHVEPEKYDVLENTPFLFVENEESFAQMKECLL
jgi:hypothetical protein